MKKAKAALWIIILGFIGLVVYQNWAYFDTRQVLRVDLFFLDPYPTPEFPNYFLLLLCFLMGLLLAYIYGFVERIRSNKLKKKLSEATAAQQEEISGLKRELEMLQTGSAEDEPAAAEASDAAASI